MKKMNSVRELKQTTMKRFLNFFLKRRNQNNYYQQQRHYYNMSEIAQLKVLQNASYKSVPLFNLRNLKMFVKLGTKRFRVYRISGLAARGRRLFRTLTYIYTYVKINIYIYIYIYLFIYLYMCIQL